ncbi:MAG TPA: hypothetical protein VFD49_04170 [Candidatus Dormibacteraeota bacterium]|nr:hypothetical protein [Candidatus Dormibacteraeota bacterium]
MSDQPGWEDVALVAFETEGNQRYIFATNRLRENVGASELIHRLGRIVAQGVRELGGPDLLGAGAEAGAIDAAALLSPDRNPPIERGGAFEVITAGSGQALVLAQGMARGRELVAYVTGAFLERAPGLVVRGSVVELGDEPLHRCIRQAVRRRSEIAARAPAPELRFARLPVVADCRYSGYPAMTIDPAAEGGEGAAVSASSLAKSRAAADALERLRRQLGESGRLLPRNVTKLEEGLQGRRGEATWLGLVHADGNGLGQVFLDFHHLAGATAPEDRRRYADTLRSFSAGIDLVAASAFRVAARRLLEHQGSEDEVLPLLPLIVGGDDLTVLLDGRHALTFAHDYLAALLRWPEGLDRALEAAVSTVREILGRAAERHGRRAELTACAGVAVVKPHYPFHAAYELAEDLLRSAKRHKPESALDFQVLYDSTDARLAALRERLHRSLPDPRALRLHARPYTLGEFGRFLGRLRQIRERQGEQAIPRSALARLREAAVQGREVGDAQLALELARHRKTFLGELYPNSLFTPPVTDLLDLLEAAEVWNLFGEGGSHG